MNYLQKKKLAFMSIVNRVKGFIRTVTGALSLTLEGCVDEESIIEYTLYGNSVQNGTPTPETPVEVESVGEKTANLINWDLLLSRETITKVENGYYSTVYSIAFNNNTDILKQIKSVLKPDTTYTLSRVYDGALNASNGFIFLRLSSNKDIGLCPFGRGLKSKTFSLTQEEIDSIQYIIFCFGGTITNLQVTESDTVLPYEPYGYKIPIKVSGKNLFDINSVKKMYTSSGADVSLYLSITDGVLKNRYGGYADSTYIPCNIKTLSVGTYTFSCEVSGVDSSAGNIAILWNNGGKSLGFKNPDGTNWEKISRTFTLEEETTINGVRFQGNGGASNYLNLDIYFRNIQIEKSETATEYEPYHEPTTTNIYLDEPLRKVGDYADYIDFENGKVVRNVVFHIFNGGENITLPSGIIEGYTPFRYIKNDWEAVLPFVCNYYPYNNTTYNQISGKECLAKYYANAKQMFFITSNERIPLNDTTVFKNWLKELYTSGKPVIVYAGTSTPTETPITLPTIPTFRGTTILTADTTIQPSNAEVTYYSTLKG